LAGSRLRKQYNYISQTHLIPYSLPNILLPIPTS